VSVALGIQHVPYCHLWSVWLYIILPHHVINSTIFGWKFLNTKCVSWSQLQTLSETFLVVRKIQRAIVINVQTSECKIRVIVADLNETWIFSIDFGKISWKALQVGAKPFHADGDTDRHDDANSTFAVALKALEKSTLILTIQIFYRIHVFTHQYSYQNPVYMACGSSVDKRHDWFFFYLKRTLICGIYVK
jgi:hypothetical protein